MGIILTNEKTHMKFKILKLSGLILITPLTALASGDYILPALLIDLVLFILIIITIFILKIKWMGKLILFVTYFAAMFLLFYLIDQVNYLKNQTLINVGSAVLPTAIVYVTYKLIRGRFQKLDSR